MVLTSPRSFYVDVRFLKRPISRPDGGVKQLHRSELTGLQWAFAGTSESSLDDHGRRFSTWHHWIDSNSDDPVVDRGEMITQENGNVLEKGTMVDPNTGQEDYYEELWEEVPTEKLTSGNNERVCTVLRTGDQEKLGMGMIIRLGDYCQGILKSQGRVTVQRWKWDLIQKDRGYGDWRNILTIGTESENLPCQDLLDLETPPNEGEEIKGADITWTVVEVSTW